MRKSLLSLVLATFLLLILSCEAASIEEIDIVNYESGEEGENLKTDTSEGSKTDEVDAKKGDEISLEEYELIRVLNSFDKDEIFSSGLWIESVRKDNLPVVKNVLNNYSAGDDETLRRIFCDTIENGAFRIFIYMIEEYKEVLRPKSNAECIYLINLALKTNRHKMSSIFNGEFLENITNGLPSIQGRTFLHECVISGEDMVVLYCLRIKGLQVNIADDFGNTPLHYASNPTIFKTLIRGRKADPFIKNNAGLNAIDIHNFPLSTRFELLCYFHRYIEKFNDNIEFYVIDRKRVLEDSFYFASIDPRLYDLTYEFDIEFKRESGVDDGGLSREWLSLLVERFFVPRLENDSETDIDFGYFPIFPQALQSENLAAAHESHDSESVVKLESGMKNCNIDSESGFSYESSSISSSNSNSISSNSDSSSLSSSDDGSDSIDSTSTIENYAAEGGELYNGAPFECIDSINRIYRISPSFTGPAEVYKFIGSIMARGILKFVPLRVRLAPSLVKMLLGKTLTYEDLKDEDPILYRSFMKCLEPDFDFEVAAYNLLSDESVMVDAENIVVFLNEKAAEIMYLRYKDQIDQFVEGFRSILNIKELEAFFSSSSELETVLTGVIKVDRLDLYNYIEFEGIYWNKNKELFWAGMDLLSDDELFKFVRFITGINGIPFGGISALGNTFRVFDLEPGMLIRATTCNYILRLPTTIETAEELVETFRFAFASGLEFSD